VLREKEKTVGGESDIRPKQGRHRRDLLFNDQGLSNADIGPTLHRESLGIEKRPKERSTPAEGDSELVNKSEGGEKKGQRAIIKE